MSGASLVERLREEVAGWETAYPLSMFPEPDFACVQAALTREGLSLDSVSASNMRHVVSRLAPHIHEAADTIEALTSALQTVLRYRRGEGEFRFSHLPADERSNAAFDAWQEVEDMLVATLAKAGASS